MICVGIAVRLENARKSALTRRYEWIDDECVDETVEGENDLHFLDLIYTRSRTKSYRYIFRTDDLHICRRSKSLKNVL